MNVLELGQGFNALAQRFWPSANDSSAKPHERSNSPIQTFSPDEDMVILSTPARRASSPVAGAALTLRRHIATSDRDRRTIAEVLNHTYLRLVCHVDAICLMGMRYGMGLSTEQPYRLSSILRRVVERMGVAQDIVDVRASTMSLQTLRERMLIHGTDVVVAEDDFIMSFAWGAAYGGAQWHLGPVHSNGKLAMAIQLVGNLPLEDAQMKQEVIERATAFVSRTVSYSNLCLLRGYQQSPQGQRYVAENRRVEPKVAALFRQSSVQKALNAAFYEAFDDWK